MMNIFLSPFKFFTSVHSPPLPKLSINKMWCVNWIRYDEIVIGNDFLTENMIFLLAYTITRCEICTAFGKSVNIYFYKVVSSYAFLAAVVFSCLRPRLLRWRRKGRQRFSSAVTLSSLSRRPCPTSSRRCVYLSSRGSAVRPFCR